MRPRDVDRLPDGCDYHRPGEEPEVRLCSLRYAKRRGECEAKVRPHADWPCQGLAELKAY